MLSGSGLENRGLRKRNGLRKLDGVDQNKQCHPARRPHHEYRLLPVVPARLFPPASPNTLQAPVPSSVEPGAGGDDKLAIRQAAALGPSRSRAASHPLWRVPLGEHLGRSGRAEPSRHGSAAKHEASGRRSPLPDPGRHPHRQTRQEDGLGLQNLGPQDPTLHPRPHDPHRRDSLSRRGPALANRTVEAQGASRPPLPQAHRHGRPDDPGLCRPPRG